MVGGPCHRGISSANSVRRPLGDFVDTLSGHQVRLPGETTGRFPGRPSLAAAPHGRGTAARHAWRRAYVRRIIVGDALCALVSATIGFLVRFGPPAGDALVPHQPSRLLVALLPVVWVAVMGVARTYEQ